MQPRSQGLSSSLPSFSRSKEGKKEDPGNEVATNQSEFQTMASTRGKNRAYRARLALLLLLIGLKTARNFKPITTHSNRNRIITLESHMKTVLRYQTNQDLVALHRCDTTQRVCSD